MIKDIFGNRRENIHTHITVRPIKWDLSIPCPDPHERSNINQRQLVIVEEPHRPILFLARRLVLRRLPEFIHTHAIQRFEIRVIVLSIHNVAGRFLLIFVEVLERESYDVHVSPEKVLPVSLDRVPDVVVLQLGEGEESGCYEDVDAEEV